MIPSVTTTATRCHDYDVEGLQTRRPRCFLYRCTCRSHHLTSIRHQRLLGGQVYVCRRYGKPLTRVPTDPGD